MSSRFGRQKIKTGIKHFLIGKVLSSLAGFIALILTVRGLSISEFAAYSILIALVEYVTALSGFGLTHVVMRYVPELYGREYYYAFRKFISRVIYCRVASLLLLGVVAYLFSDKLSMLLGEQVPKQAFEAFLLVASIRTGSYFLSQILDSTLCQGVSQVAFMLSALTKAALIYVLLCIDEAGLINVILVEAIGDVISIIVMMFGVHRVLNAKRSDDVPVDDAVWLKNKRKTIFNYAITGYLQHLMILPCGGQTNRLIGGHFLSVFSMASYGFAQSLYEYCKRYLPAQLLLGVIRPVIISRYAANSDFKAAVKLTETFFKVNALMLAPLLVILLVVGPEIVEVISKGKYGSESSLILVFLIIVLFFETARMQLDVLIQAIERYHYLIFANIFLTVSIIPSLYLLNCFGAWVMPALNLLGLALSNGIVLRKLWSNGFYYSHDWDSTCRIVVISVITYIVSSVFYYIFPGSWVVACLLVGFVYPILVLLIYRKQLADILSSMKMKYDAGQ